MAEPFLSEIRMFSFRFAPQGWALCNGQLIPVNQNQSLFALLGTTYGGDGSTNFALPDLRARLPIHRGAGFFLGQRGGSQTHTLTQAQMPAHFHFLVADNSPPAADGQNPTPSRRLSRSNPGTLYGAAASLVAMSPAAVSSVGGGQAHSNMQPFLTVSFCIALQGIFPPRN